MLFNIESESDGRIRGYVVPDAFSGTASIQVTVDDRPPATVNADDPRPSLVAAGRHETGRCGFELTEDVVAGLSTAGFVEIRDAATGLAFYRRRHGLAIPSARLFRLETRHTRWSDLDRCLAPLFGLAFPAVDGLGHETMLQALLLTTRSSVYVSGRLPYKPVEFSLSSDLLRTCLMQDPCLELAETLIAFTGRAAEDEAPGNLRERLALSEAAAYFHDTDLDSARAIDRAMARMPPAIAAALSNPAARMLAARSTDETTNTSFVSTAVETLASFDLVGLRERPDAFLKPLEALLGVPAGSLALDAASPQAADLAALLKTTGWADQLIDLDQAIHDCVQAAIDSAWTTTPA